MSQSETLYFHLPPNRYSESDKRTTFQIANKDNQIRYFQRSEFGKLKLYHRQNLHSAQSIKISRVTVNGRLTEFQILDNPALSPTLAIKNALLVINTGDYLSNKEKTYHIKVDFQTDFEKFLKNNVTLLWDFAPRLVRAYKGNQDFADHISSPSLFHYDFKVLNSNQKKQSIRFEQSILDTVPTFIISEKSQLNNTTFLSLDQFLDDDKIFYKNRIQKVQSFLFRFGWLKEDNLKTYIATWDGPLIATGSHILLPQSLFRYHPVYYKTFEIVLIRALIIAALKKRYFLNSHSFPWMYPALSSEAIRDYFSLVYDSDTRFFPWGQWLNPDYHQENTIKKWLSKPDESKLISAAEERDLQYLTNSYHPWYEKGSHLLRTISQSDQALKSQIIPALKDLLTSAGANIRYLDDLNLSSILKLTNGQIEEIQIWLSEDGSVDFEISDVDIVKNDKEVKVAVLISSFGSLTPAFELSFTLENGQTIIEEITNGSGKHEFLLNSNPVEISIDPEYKLLENNVLNNYWYTPFKIRPIWDFPSSNNWIVTLSPVINGNTFNKNLFGLSLGVSYLNKSELYVSAWRGDGDEQTLWESSFFQYGIPWKGSELSLGSSELNASFSKSLGYKQSYFDIHKDLWFSVNFIEESMETAEGDISSDHNTWQSVETSFSFPVFTGDFSDSFCELYNGYGRNTYDVTNDFYQQGITSSSLWYLDNWQIQFSVEANYSYGVIPLQKKYPIGGPEGLPGFPRETELLYNQRQIATFGLTFPPYLTHTNLNLLRLAWLDRLETALIFHWGEGLSPDIEKSDAFKDVELRFKGFFSWLNIYEGEGFLSIAKPLDHEKYKDYRIILFSDWVF